MIRTVTNDETQWKLVLIEPDDNQVKRAADAWLDNSSKLILNKSRLALRTAIAASQPYHESNFVESLDSSMPTILKEQANIFGNRK